MAEPELDWMGLAGAEDNHRPHAGHFSWETDRAVEERGVLSELVEALEKRGELFFSNPRHRRPGNDPPDCEADDGAGGRVGIEVTELVDPDSIKAARAGEDYDWRDWRIGLIPALDDILRKKDAPTKLKGGPYSEYVLVIYTDEPWLELEHTRRLLANHVFPVTTLITKAYLLVSYEPSERAYPCIPLNLETA